MDIRPTLYVVRKLWIGRGADVAGMAPSTSLGEFKALKREQFYLLLIDQDAALAPIPKMLPEDTEVRRLALDAIKRVLTAFGPLDGQDHERLERIARLFNLGNTAVSVENVISLSPARPEVQSRAPSGRTADQSVR